MVTLEYLGDIRVLVDVGLKVYFSTNPRAVCDTYRNSPIDRSERITLRWFRTLQIIPFYVLR